MCFKLKLTLHSFIVDPDEGQLIDSSNMGTGVSISKSRIKAAKATELELLRDVGTYFAASEDRQALYNRGNKSHHINGGTDDNEYVTLDDDDDDDDADSK